MDKVHKPSDSECYTPSSEPFMFRKFVSSLFILSFLGYFFFETLPMQLYTKDVII
jgi:hypothetical protein